MVISLKKITNRVPDSNRALLAFLLGGDYSQPALDHLLSVWDLDAEGSVNGMLLASVKQAHPELVFPEYVGPRLDGLLRYFRFRYVDLMARVRPLLNALAEQGIPLVALDDFAMRITFPDKPRPIYRIDFGVSAVNYQAAKRHIGPDIMIRVVPDSFFNGASVDVAGVRVYVPGADQLVCRALVRLAAYVDGPGNGSELPKLIADVSALSDMNPSAAAVRKCAADCGTGARLRAACGYLEELAPGVNVSGYAEDCCSHWQWTGYRCKRFVKAIVWKIWNPSRMR